MLCEFCAKQIPTGRKPAAKTCSEACRSALYRKRKRQGRDTPQQTSAPRGSPKTGVASSPSQRRRSLHSDPAKWEHIVSAAADRIIEAIRTHRLSSESAGPLPWRMDLRKQVIMQAPRNAVGYRLALQARHDMDSPVLVPRRSRARDVAWYSLQDFEYPDDLRLRDGTWYRIVWIDGQGQRIRPTRGEPVPGLYFFIGPAQLPSAAPTIGPELAPDASTESGRAAPQAVSPEAPLPTTPLPNEPASVPMPAATASDLSDEDVLAIVKALEAQNSPSTAPARAPQWFVSKMLPDKGHGKSSLALPPTSPPPPEWQALLANFPPMSPAESTAVCDFVLSPDCMVQLLWEERAAQAKASGVAPPAEPLTQLGADERRRIRGRLTNQLPPHFIPLCKSIFAFIRKHGTEPLAHMPVPVPSLSTKAERWMKQAFSQHEQRRYLQYIADWQEALLAGQPAPTEPSGKLSSRERRELRMLMRDMRSIELFRRLTKPAAAPA